MSSKHNSHYLNTDEEKIQFIDLKTQQQLLRLQIDAAIKKVLDHGTYIMGPEVAKLEADLANFCGAKHAITCANGTDALGLGLMAMNVGPGDAVFVPSFTFAATAEVVAWVGATPVFIDSDKNTYNIDPKSLEQGIQTAKKNGLKPTCIVPVDLFGQPADYNTLEIIAQKYNLWIMADAAQSFGAKYKDRLVSNIGHIATTSFFPAKPLGCYGDGGAIFTSDDNIAQKIKSLRVHGQGADKYDNIAIGMNARLDTLQAAILIEKLKVFPQEILNRQKAADYYNNKLTDKLQKPKIIEDATSTWAQYTVVLDQSVDRQELMNQLNQQGIPTFIYYVKPLHLQKAYGNYLTATAKELPVCEELANRVLSLPMHGYMTDSNLKKITKILNQYLE